MDHIVYHFVVDPPEPGTDILIALIGEMGFEQFTTSETGFDAYIDSKLEKNVDLSALEFEDFRFTYSTEFINGKNWNEEWEKNFEPVVISDLLCIRAPFHNSLPKVRYEIVIMPKMSFGTGHHATTRLMCSMLFGVDCREKRVLDMGCGTGVLAILAKKLGADAVVAVDNDEWCVENSTENCARNNCASIEVKLGGDGILRELGAFDIILANINKNILIRQLHSYSTMLKHGGELFMSGFFSVDVPDLRAALPAGLSIAQTQSEGEWAAIRVHNA
jgi:ribosomal protein L11 methyltransferase